MTDKTLVLVEVPTASLPAFRTLIGSVGEDGEYEPIAKIVSTRPDMWWDKDDPETPYDSAEAWAWENAPSRNPEPSIVEFMTGFRAMNNVVTLLVPINVTDDEWDYSARYFNTVEEAKAALEPAR